MKTLPLYLLFTLAVAADELPPSVRMAQSAEQFLAGLDEGQRAKAALPFDSSERENFRYTPRDRAGLQFKEMTAAQREASMNLLETAVSDKGKLKVTQIMTLEGILADLEKNPTYRDAGKYCVAVFGTPGDATGWGWRFEGHHVSMNFTVIEGKKISLTPSFLGANPAEVREGPHTKMRVLAAEEDLSRTLVTSLVSAGKSQVIFSEKSLAEIISGESRKITELEPVGVIYTEMSEAQQKGLMELISEYTGRYRKDIAEADLAKIEKAGVDKIRFAWSGGTKPGEAYYYRVQGPTFLLEAVNSQNNANHIHAVWRDFDGDFGRDVLAEHLQQDH